MNIELSKFKKKDLSGFILIALLVVTIVYGTTYQQFRHFDISDPRGLADVHGYVEMAQGNFGVEPLHRYRAIIPWLAGATASLLDDAGPNNNTIILGFYIVNFIFIVASALFLFYFFFGVTRSTLLSFIGLIIFLSSRQTIIAGALPLIDSYYLLGIAIFVWLAFKRKVILLALVLPLLVLSKELIIPFIFLPLFDKDFRRWEYICGILGALVAVWAFRYGINLIYIDQIQQYKSGAYITKAERGLVFEISGMLEVISNGVVRLISQTLTLRQLHNWQNGFVFALPLAILGIIISIRQRKNEMGLAATLILPACFFYALVNDNTGRLLFGAYPIIIGFALFSIRDILKKTSFSS